MKIVSLLLFILFSITLHSQAVYLRVLKGSAILNKEKLVPANGVRVMTPKAYLSVSKNSVVMLRLSKKIVEVRGVKKYSTNEIIDIFHKKEDGLGSDGYFDVLFNDNMQKEVAPISSGAVTRGGLGGQVNWDELQVAPKDSIVLASEYVLFKIENEGVRVADSIKIRKIDSDIWTNYKLNEGKLSNKEFQSGWYEWQWNIEALHAESDKEFVTQGHFKIPTKTEVEQFEKLQQDFEKSISSYDSSVKELLLNSFFQSHHWYKQ